MTNHRPGTARARKGETLVEVLVALLIATLATLLLASMVTASARVNIAAKQKDDEFFEVLTRVEAMDDDIKSDDPYTVEIQEIDPGAWENDVPGTTPTEIPNVHVYSPDDGQLAFYGLD